jgi:hypothetical protein
MRDPKAIKMIAATAVRKQAGYHFMEVRHPVVSHEELDEFMAMVVRFLRKVFNDVSCTAQGVAWPNLLSEIDFHLWFFLNSSELFFAGAYTFPQSLHLVEKNCV